MSDKIQDQSQAASPPATRPAAGPINQPPATISNTEDDLDFETEPEVASTPPEPAPTPSPAPQKAKHPAWLVRTAQQVGLSRSEIDAYETDVLGEIVDARLSQARATPEPKAKEPEKEEEVDLGIDEADFDPDFVKALKSVHSKNAQEIKTLKKQLADREQREAQREVARTTAALDGAFESLGSRFERLFGKGGINALPAEAAAEKKRRITVLMAAGVNPKNIGELSDADIRRAVKVAAEELYGPAAAREEEPEEVKVRKEKWANGGVRKPTHRERAVPANGQDKAVKAVAAKLRERGFDTSESSSDEEQGLPE